MNFGREVVYHVATRGTPRLEGEDWEEIFARLVGAKWQPSNVGLDDIVYEQCAWGAKTVKNKLSSKTIRVRLISGRNSPAYSFGDNEIKGVDPDQLGEKVLSIWNGRVTDVRKKFAHVRTVVLIKSDDLLELAVFETDTCLYRPENYKWEWNEKDNLEGYEVFSDKTEIHRFTWQPHGSGLRGRCLGFCGRSPAFRGRGADFAGTSQDFAGSIRDFMGTSRDFAGAAYFTQIRLETEAFHG